MSANSFTRLAPASTALDLRDYQREALSAIDAAARRGVQRQLIALPTGTGKTCVFSALIAQRGGRALVLVHRDELVSQTLDKLARVGLTDVGVVKAERNEVNAQVIVASVQTISRPNRLGLLTYATGPLTTAVVDEAHHATAETYRRVLEYIGAFRQPGPLVLGVTATAERADGTALGDVFEEIVYTKPLLGMIRAGHLSDLRAIQVQIQADFQELHTRAGDIVDSESEAMLLDANAPEEIVAAYVTHASDRLVLAFTPTVKVAYAVAAAFQDAGIPAAAIDGTTPLDARHDILAAFHRGDIRVLANCGVLTEGYDEPAVNCIIMARPTKSRPLFVQCIGRGTRRYPGKTDCLILDVVGMTARHDLQTTASLFGVPQDATLAASVLDAVDAEARRGQVGQMEEAEAKQGTMQVRDVDLFRVTPLNWVVVSPERYALAIGNSTTLLLTTAPNNRWVVRERPKGESEIILWEGTDLGYAQGWAEDHARASGAGILIKRDAKWRQAPASDKQLALLRKCGVPCPSELTKGAAADLITARFARR